MKRREFIAGLGCAAAPWSLAARAQQAGKLPTIGLLGTGSQAAWAPWTAAFVRRIHDLGWVEGRTVAIEYRWAEGRPDRHAEIAAEFVRMKVDVIVTSGTAGLATKQATSTIPIVFTIFSDPIGSGLVASLARPGGNITGLSTQTDDLAGKRLGILREMLPSLRSVGVMLDAGLPSSVVEAGELEVAARTLGWNVVKLGIRRSEDIPGAFDQLKDGAGALYVCTGALVNTNRVRINTLANAARLPTMHADRVYIEAGGLISYGPSILDMFRRAGDLVDKILRGTKPGDIPVEQPTKFDLIVNLTTAKALGLKIPETFLLRVDEVIE